MFNFTISPDNIASLTVEVTGVVPFIFLLPFVLVMVVKRLVDLKNHDWRRQMPIIITMFLTLVYCLYQIPAGLIVGTGTYFGDNVLPLIVIRNMIPYIHNTLFIWLSASYIWVLVRASIAFDVIVIAALVTSREDRNRKKRILKILRTLSGVIILLGSFVFFLTAVALCIMYGLRKYGYIPTRIYQIASIAMNAATSSTIILSLILILIVFTVLLIVALRKANQALVKSHDNKAMQQHMAKIKERKLVITRYGIGMLIYTIQGLIMLCGVIWYLSRMTTPFYIENVGTDLTMRVIPSIIFIIAMLVVFWPFKLPKIACTGHTLSKVFNATVNVETEDDLVTTESTITTISHVE